MQVLSLDDAYKEIQKLTISEPMNEYHENSKYFLSSGKLRIFRDISPATYYADLKGDIPEKDTSYFALGRAAHTLILEGVDTYEKEYRIGGPLNPKTGKPYGRDTKKFYEWCEEEGISPENVLSESDHKLCQNMRDGVLKNKDAVKLLSEGVAERVVRANYKGVNCQVRIDHLGPHYGITNLKTCQDLNQFERDAKYKFGYAEAEVFYREVVHAANPDLPRLPITLLAVEKKPPYRSGIFLLDPELIQDALDKNEEAIEDLKECRRSGYWPTRFEGQNVIYK